MRRARPSPAGFASAAALLPPTRALRPFTCGLRRAPCMAARPPPAHVPAPPAPADAGCAAGMWAGMQAEARLVAADEPLLASFLYSTVLAHDGVGRALAFHLANKLASPAIPATQLVRLFGAAFENPAAEEVIRRDVLAVVSRDPACTRMVDCLCYFKGFHALCAHRAAHALWREGRVALAYHLQAQVSKTLQVDVHPAAVVGPGAFLDHATGVVIGETAVIGDDVSMLHHVTLGGSGKTHGVRHPQIGRGVLIGAGATILGAVSVGDGAQIGACSLVLEDVPAGATVVGVPAKTVRMGDPSAKKVVPALHMKHERCIQGRGDDATRAAALNGKVVDAAVPPHAAENGPLGDAVEAVEPVETIDAVHRQSAADRTGRVL